MASPAVVFDSVSKKFRRGERHDSLRDAIPALLRGFTSGANSKRLSQPGDFWALEDVSFQVQPGQALGVIGPNGAGKSTTLKLLTRILRPTRGNCFVRGRVGALIEVAAGFHPDLTGRENIYLQGAIMGMRRLEVKTRLEEIVEFAGVADFIDTPVKRYSTGMNARLGFSIAAHLNPDVLIIDEVLSVGDATFQERCLERMISFRKHGTTLVFVSHDLQAVSCLCDEALYLNHRSRAYGSTADVVAKYLRESHNTLPNDPAASVSLTRGVLVDAPEHEVLSVKPHAPLSLNVDVFIKEPLQDLTLGLILYRSTDHLVLHEANILASDMGFDARRQGVHRIRFDFDANLIRGQYHLECYVLHTPTNVYLARLCPAAMFSVQDSGTCGGVAAINLRASAYEPLFQ